MEFAQTRKLFPDKPPLEPPAGVFCQPGWKLLVPSQAAAGKWTSEVEHKIWPQVANGFLVMSTQDEAKEYKRNARGCPTIVCLDGFVLQESGAYGGRGGQKKTRLEEVRGAGHFGFNPSAGADVSQLQKIDAQLQELSEYDGSVRAIEPSVEDNRRRAADMEAQLKKKWGDDALRESQQEAAATQYQYQFEGSYQTRKRSAEALEREGGATRARVAVAMAAGSSSAPPGPVELTRGGGGKWPFPG